MTSGMQAQAIASALPRRSFKSLLKKPIIYIPLSAGRPLEWLVPRTG
jgi:hypothetical protein